MPMAGRTHGQHAVPATFGYKVAVWIDELLRHVERLRQAAPSPRSASRGRRCRRASAAGSASVR
ncbi:lyase family protein [Mycobacterium tuberculosis]|uniref:lyase family protein n=1 Tax=Mycobacterium tuberculosis TaxID=1773 RepID=UPI003510C18A